MLFRSRNVPDTLPCCIPAVQAVAVHRFYLPALFKYFAVFKVLLNVSESSVLPPDPFQMGLNQEVRVNKSTLSVYLSLFFSPSLGVSLYASHSLTHSLSFCLL